MKLCIIKCAIENTDGTNGRDNKNIFLRNKRYTRGVEIFVQRAFFQKGRIQKKVNFYGAEKHQEVALYVLTHV